ncbi:MAG: DEAD/DEAH box helicase [Leptothrix sp. (in: b-proteobacteria)]
MKLEPGRYGLAPVAAAVREISLRDYQQVAVDEVRAAFAAKRWPVLFVLPTGGGKTYTFSYIASSAAKLGRHVVIIVHRKELLKQASDSLRNLGITHGLISPQFTPQPHHLVQVASVDTLIQRLKTRTMRADLVIFDEAHHVVDGNKWARVYQLLGSPPMLGVTATPVRTDGKGLGLEFGGLFKSMVLGPTVAELIKRKMLLDPITYTSLEVPDLSGLKTNSSGDYNANDLADRVDKPVITGSAVAHYSEICPGARAIVFCSSVAHAQHVTAEFNAAGYRFAVLVGEPAMADSERTAVNAKLRTGELQGACTVDLVSEGYDLPDLQCCIMLRPTQSEGLFLQQVGRVMRPSPGKTECWLLDHVGNVGAMRDGAFARKHGLPGEVRDWTLEGKKKKKGKKKDDDGPPLKQCPSCYRVHEPAPICPHCGHEYVTHGRELEQVDGQIVKVTPEMAAQIAAAKKAEVKKAKTLEDLKRIERERGYKPGWAEATHTAKARIREKYTRPTPPMSAYENDFRR